MLFRKRIRIAPECEIMNGRSHFCRLRKEKRSCLNRQKKFVWFLSVKFPSETRLHPRYRKWADFDPIIGKHCGRKLGIEFCLMIQQKFRLWRILAETLEQFLQVHARSI